ncbi:MAG: tetratricopeptide repeat protein [Chloroflexota bacterium]|nr:tetratricopeptide repeat protein [Chloroflexota bacterium]
MAPPGSPQNPKGLPAAWYARWFPLARFVWVGAAGAAWYVRPHLGPWIVALAAAPWAIRALLTGQVWRRTPFDAPLVVFLATAAASLAVAYDPHGARAVFPAPVGWTKLWGLLLAALLFGAVAALGADEQRRWVVRLLSAFGAAVAVWFLATNEWDPAAGDLLSRVGRLIQAPLPTIPGHRLNPNVAGGLAALMLPMAMELAGTADGERGRRGEGENGKHAEGARWLWLVWGVVAAAVMGLAVALTGSRGAWVASAAVVVLCAAWWLAGRTEGTAEGETRRQGDGDTAGGSVRRSSRQATGSPGLSGWRRVARFLALVVEVGVVGAALVRAVPGLRARVLGSEALANRLALYSQGLLLVRDYPFTGCGLGHFPVVHSTYALLIHVPVLVFSHSTPLDVAIEQGVPAALTLLAMWAGAAWMGLRALASRRQRPAGLVAGLLSLAVLVVHGTGDSAVYGSRALVLFWLPVGLVVAAGRQDAEGGGRQGEGETERPPDPSTGPFEHTQGMLRTGKGRGRWSGVVATALLALVVGAAFWRPLGAAWQANLGAVNQTLVELRAYDWHSFGDPTLAEVRQEEDLSGAVAHFQRAIALDPGQPTARTRLSQIAHARGAYDQALAHAQAAWDAGHRDRVTRLVLGDALVAHGRVDEAVGLVRGVERAAMRLGGQAFYQYHRQGDAVREAWARAAAGRVNEDDALRSHVLRSHVLRSHVLRSHVLRSHVGQVSIPAKPANAGRPKHGPHTAVIDRKVVH